MPASPCSTRTGRFSLEIFIGDVGDGDLWYFPAGYQHSIQGLGPDGCEFLLVFDDGAFSEYGTFLLSDWVAHTPKQGSLYLSHEGHDGERRRRSVFDSSAKARTMNFNANDVGFVPAVAGH